MTALQLLLGVLTLVTNAFFVGGEFSLVTVRRSQLEPRAEAGHRRARTVIWGLEHVSVLLATAQLGVTASSLVLGAAAEPGITHLLEPALTAAGLPDGLIRTLAFVIALTAATYLHMLFGEMVPKNIALAAPERTALLLVPPLVTLTRVLRPLVVAVNAVAGTLLRLLRVQVRDEIPAAFTEQELARMVQDSARARLLRDRDTRLLQDVLELGSHRVADVLQPLDTMTCAGPDTIPEGLEQLAARTGYSRFPVRDSGTLLGYLHVKDALHYIPRDQPFPPHALRPVTQVPADTPLDDIITAMRRSGTHLAAVTGAGGTPVGLVTMEDALRELLGHSAGRAGRAGAGPAATPALTPPITQLPHLPARGPRPGACPSFIDATRLRRAQKIGDIATRASALSRPRVTIPWAMGRDDVPDRRRGHGPGDASWAHEAAW